MRGYLMVICTFRQPRRTSPMILEWFWSSDSDYFENICRCYFRHPETFKSDDAQDSSLLGRDDRVRWHTEILYGYPHLSSTKANEFDDIRMMLVVRFWLFWKSLQVLLSSTRDIQVRRCARFFSARQGRSSSIACGNVMVIPFYRFRGTEVLLTLLMSFFSEWQVPLIGILIGRMMFRSNEISVLSLFRFYLQ